ncbi:hypothetical protein MNEG_14940 [Monoraphidium neglectum]|uniref:Uncharacterized protein n=1 Tax=Monoraphidium neglectum TaxID=145388 RepID=A0A0D2IYQ8_9CHLO|nr:hypothetical protein MNEG_14940 [Monoraphidium neglectum]KIY93022.1 hypothetical protein MNEG_14940 [Monoraphidium neglectum]|eukprot:XP_013892042.1 hypothetical protein MNEG_14940 [Monoraphidium neglectum]
MWAVEMAMANDAWARAAKAGTPVAVASSAAAEPDATNTGAPGAAPRPGTKRPHPQGMAAYEARGSWSGGAAPFDPTWP